MTTYINQAKVVLVDRELFRANLFFQGGGIGALKEENETLHMTAIKTCLCLQDLCSSSSSVRHLSQVDRISEPWGA